MIPPKKNASFLISFYVVISLLIGGSLSKYFTLGLIFFSNIFFTAYSDAKLIVFLIYLAILFLSAYCFSSKVQMKKWHIMLLHTLIFCLAGASIFSYIYVTNSFGLTFKSSSSFMYQGAYDTTVGPFHIHTFKPAFTWILTIFGIQNVPYYGSGLAFFQAFKELRPFYIISSLFLFLTTYLLIMYGIHLSKKQGVLFLWVYGVFSYGIVKAITDGGPLWYEFYLNYALFCILVYFFSHTTRVSWKKIVVLMLGSALGIYITLVLLTLVVNSLFVLQMLYVRPIIEYALFFTGLGLILYIYERKKYRILILICFIVGLSCNLSAPIISYIDYSLKEVAPQDKVTLISSKIVKLPLIVKEGHLYWYRVPITKKESIFSIAMRYSSLFYHEISIEGKTCNSKKTISQSMYVSAMGATFKGPSTSPSLFFQTFTIEPMRSKSHTYWISYTYTDCLSDSRAAVLSHLQDLGFYSFIVYQ